MAKANKTEQASLLIPIPATPMGAVERFVVADVIKIGAKIGNYEVAWIGDNFKQHFLGVVEENVPARELPGHTLARYSRDEPIINGMGGTMKKLGPAATALSHLFGVIPLGKSGPGLFNGYANIGYKLSPIDQEPWAVDWSVDDGELSVDAFPASDPDDWGGGDRVFGG